MQFPINGISASQLYDALTPKGLELIILPTEKCNFRCTYCYEDFELGKMPEPVQRGIENLLTIRAQDLRGIRFSWFGGEPLLAADVILRLSRFANDLCREHDLGFSGGITTNAYLLKRELASQLLDLRQAFFQITLDGWREVHDQTRRRADGRGTFEVIWNNLLDLKSLPQFFSCCLRLHLRPDNVESVTELVGHLKDTLLDDKRFYMDFQHIRNLGGEGGKTIKDWDMHEYHAVVAQIHSSLGMATPAPTKASDRAASPSQPADAHGICYASKPNSLLIRSDGRIGKCTVALSDKRNDIGHLNEDGSLTIDNPRLAFWIRGFRNLDTETLECPATELFKQGTPMQVVPRASKAPKLETA